MATATNPSAPTNRADAADDQTGAYRPGPFGCHELLDRLSLVGDLVEERVLNHPACAADPAWRAMAARAADALRDLYQAVGAAHMAADDRA